MPEITFITILNNLGFDNYNEKLFGKVLTDYISDDNEGLDLEIKNILEDCLKKFNEVNVCEFTINSLGIIGVIENHFNSESDREIFDLYIDEINKKFYFCNREINFENESQSESDN
jgi:histidyl-tRNA synthetase